MSKSKTAFIGLLMMSFTLYSTKISSQEIPKPDNYSSLSRDQKEKIAECFETNFLCHQTLKHHDDSAFEWPTLAAAFALGVLGGLVLEHQLSN